MSAKDSMLRDMEGMAIPEMKRLMECDYRRGRLYLSTSQAMRRVIMAEVQKALELDVESWYQHQTHSTEREP